MTRRRKQKRQTQSRADQRRARPEPRLPSELQRKFADVGLELARSELRRRHWRAAYEFAEQSRGADASGAAAVMAEASAREARRAALTGRFADAELYARRA